MKEIIKALLRTLFGVGIAGLSTSMVLDDLPVAIITGIVIGVGTYGWSK